jgi:hypothetical protein
LQVNQLLSLFFVVMVQVVIMAEWFVLNMPIAAIVSSSGNLHCDVPKVCKIHISIGTRTSVFHLSFVTFALERDIPILAGLDPAIF